MTRTMPRSIDSFSRRDKLEAYLMDGWDQTIWDMRFSRFWASNDAWDFEDFEQ